jgi:hypothetical protein
MVVANYFFEFCYFFVCLGSGRCAAVESSFGNTLLMVCLGSGLCSALLSIFGIVVSLVWGAFESTAGGTMGLCVLVSAPTGAGPPQLHDAKKMVTNEATTKY